jgi:hypothetical protein
MNEQNLKPMESGREARENGKKGGIKSGEVRREKRIIANALEDLLLSNKGEKLKELVSKSTARELKKGGFDCLLTVAKIFGEVTDKVSAEIAGYEEALAKYLNAGKE